MVVATSFAGVLRAEHSKEEKSSEHVKEEKSAYGKEEKSESFVGLKKRRSNSSDSTSAVKTEPSQKRHCPTETLTTQLSSFHNTPKGSVHVKIEGAADASLLGHKAVSTRKYGKPITSDLPFLVCNEGRPLLLKCSSYINNF
eukprot:GHVT01088485.1.p3 GENE.GHVT01088485.1~~GHVT01088485.1.p3  ORF type:complete len:142 (+),score=22.10 GHVT01088485.1:1544-1969(+)